MAVQYSNLFLAISVFSSIFALLGIFKEEKKCALSAITKC
jgi:hypothetical protein